MTARPPVADWATDWDHLDPAWTSDPYPNLGRVCGEQLPGCPYRPLQGRLLPDALSRTSATSPTITSISRRGAWSSARAIIG